MDYGQPAQQTIQPAGPDFFTSGSGTNNEQINNTEPENNLDLSNGQTNWSNPVERNQQNIGQQAINSLESNQINPNVINLDPSLNPLEMPPEGVKTPGESIPPTPEGYASLDPVIIAKNDETQNEVKELSAKDIKTADRLSDDSVKIVDETVAKFNQGKEDPAEFYNKVREMMETNLENSYNRKLAS